MGGVRWRGIGWRCGAGWRGTWGWALAAVIALGACGGPPDGWGDAPVETGSGGEGPADTSAGPTADQVETWTIAGPPPDVHQTFPAVDPRDGALWFSTYDDGFDDQTLWRAPAEDDGWGTATVVSFSGTWGDRAARFSPDGTRLFFTSNRPLPGETEAGDMNIWVVERMDAAWGDPVPVPHPVSTDDPDIHATVSASAVWVPSARPGGMGRSDLYRVPFDPSGGFGAAEHLPAPLNNERSQPDVWIAPDESWLVLAVTDQPEGYGGDDLWWSRRTEAGWSAPVNLGAAVNSPDYEYGPTVTPDGAWLLFTSHRDGTARTRRVPLASVGPPRS